MTGQGGPGGPGRPGDSTTSEQTTPQGAPTPTIAQRAPYPIEVQAGRSYWWCTCGIPRSTVDWDTPQADGIRGRGVDDGDG
jgi:hypothetical protein